MNEKQKRMKSLANENGIFHIFAIDHRDVFANSFSKQIGHQANKEEIAEEKIRLIKAVSDLASGFLIDPVYFVQDGMLRENVSDLPVMIGIENNNYDVTQIGSDYLYKNTSVEAIKKSGGKMVKLFVYYHPEMNFRFQILDIIRQVETECTRYQMPFLLEPVLYLEEEMDAENKLNLMKEMLVQLSGFQIDVFKLEFPGNINCYDEEKNVQICQEITSFLKKPWIVLSSGVEADVFEKQIEYSGKGGACGYAVGRSVWGSYLGTEKEKLNQMRQLLTRFVNCADKYCSPFDERRKDENRITPFHVM